MREPTRRAINVKSSAPADRLVIVPLILLSVVPVLAGTVRLIELGRALYMGAGWAINIVVAEWLILRRRALPARSPATS